MADNTLVAIAAARRAMEQVVSPSVDPEDSLAREQAELVAGTLRMLEAQLPFLRERNAYELRQNIDLARELVQYADGELRSRLEDEVTSAERLMSTLGPSNQELSEATARLTALASALVRSSEAASPRTRSELLRQVLTHADGVIAGQRSWFSTQGWSGADEVPSPAQTYSPS